MSQLTVEGGKLVSKSGALGTGQGCCCASCSCNMTALYNSGATVSVAVTIILPDVPGDCPAGTYETEFALEFSGFNGGFYACQDIDFGGFGGSVIAQLVCENGKYKSFCNVYAYSCGQVGYNCSIAGFIGFGPALEEITVHGATTINGVCVPTNAGGGFSIYDMQVQYDFTVTP